MINIEEVFMNNLDIIFQRKSIRQYQQKSIPNEMINIILDAGFSAPSARNLRPYHFLLIDDKNILNKISTLSPGKKIIANCALAIAVLGDLNINDVYEFVLNDTSACIENMLLAIEGLGLGGCWCGQRRDDSEKIIKELFKLPDGVFVSGFIALGYPNEIKTTKNRFDKEKVHHNKW